MEKVFDRKRTFVLEAISAKPGELEAKWKKKQKQELYLVINFYESVLVKNVRN